MIANPHRINLGRIGLWFGGQNISEEMLINKSQTLHLWSGSAESVFWLDKKKIEVATVVSPETDTIAVELRSQLLTQGELGLFFDFPYASGKNKFDAPFVGVWNATKKHMTALRVRGDNASIRHTLDATTYFMHLTWTGGATITRQSQDTHRYILRPNIHN
jgi:hypothetical protein